MRNLLKKALTTLGKDNNPSYVVVAIALAKGIFRPLFTMLDKKENVETKKYTALREGLTEVIAIPTYITCGYLAGKGGKLFKDPQQSKIAMHNLRFVGVCTAALFVIPALCSIAVDPLSKKLFSQNKKDADMINKEKNPSLVVKPNLNYSRIYQSNIYTTMQNLGMKVS